MNGDFEHVGRSFPEIFCSVTQAGCKRCIAAYTIMFGISLAVIFVVTSTIRAETKGGAEAKFGMAFPGEVCRVSPLSGWTKQEKWAWREICEGRTADFNIHLNRKLNPRNPQHDDNWSDDRKLRQDFLRTILVHEPFRSAIPPRGVRIFAAYFQDAIKLSNVSIDRPLMLENSFFESKVVMYRLVTPTFVSVSGSKFNHVFSMESASIGGDLFMRNQVNCSKVVLRNAKIGGQLHMRNSTFKGKLNMSAISIGGALYMQKGEFAGVFLGGAQIDGQVSMRGSKFKFKLDMDSSSVGDSLIMWKNAEFAEVALTNVKIGSMLSMDDSVFRGNLRMDSASIARSLFMRNARFEKRANLMFLSVGSNLDARGAVLRELDLTSARIKGDLRLGSPRMNIRWKDYVDGDGNPHAPMLTLRNTRVGVLQDTEDTWPNHLRREFEGFTYDRFGGYGATEHEMAYQRRAGWFIGWLEKDTSYSPQPYRHLASVLRATGHYAKADDILFGSRVRERKDSGPAQLRWWGLWAFQVIIGYGYGRWKFLALVWAAAFVGIGTSLLYIGKENDNEGKKLGFWYSLDMLLPAIHLRERHYDVDLRTWVRYYFYCHKIIGYVLMFFVIVGLSGLAE